jgi:hypothetical protein
MVHRQDHRLALVDEGDPADLVLAQPTQAHLVRQHGQAGMIEGQVVGHQAHRLGPARCQCFCSAASASTMPSP